MDRTWVRSAQKLEFKNPSIFLAKMRLIERELAASDSPRKIKKSTLNKSQRIDFVRQFKRF